MSETTILLPSKPKVISETPTHGEFEIEGLYPGYGHTLGNSLRRIILSSLPGAAITHVKIEGVNHEFSTITGVKEDVLTILLNLKKVRFVMSGDENQIATLKIKGNTSVTAKDIKVPGQVTITNPDQHLFTITAASTEIEMEITIEKGIGFVSKEVLHKDRVDIGAISLDATFSPILQANYDVDQMRVGDRTDFNRLKLMIQTDGTISPKEALEKSIEIMITQLKAIIGFKEEEIMSSKSSDMILPMEENQADKDALDDVLKTRIESIDLSQRTANALVNANIRTVGGLIRKKEEDILEIAGLGSKGLEEIKSMLESLGLSLKA
jgi:DNA-directed RNA polymerase subunit alpha